MFRGWCTTVPSPGNR
ncbi:hypothetical protein E2C01_071136 [Portunus trituberculatus]|uniref:Uncharacterized protein n=1 Tax=Portunus trituberculatus TaxID=210409 RepID=A0A5B7HUK8_PORTR|nr:hypothetical protein [Portunus trituberculatus]